MDGQFGETMSTNELKQVLGDDANTKFLLRVQTTLVMLGDLGWPRGQRRSCFFFGGGGGGGGGGVLGAHCNIKLIYQYRSATFLQICHCNYCLQSIQISHFLADTLLRRCSDMYQKSYIMMMKSLGFTTTENLWLIYDRFIMTCVSLFCVLKCACSCGNLKCAHFAIQSGAVIMLSNITWYSLAAMPAAEHNSAF